MVDSDDCCRGAKRFDLFGDAVREVFLLEVRKIPFGTFAGTVYRLLVLHNGGSLALDTGDQGGGQN